MHDSPPPPNTLQKRRLTLLVRRRLKLRVGPWGILVRQTLSWNSCGFRLPGFEEVGDPSPTHAHLVPQAPASKSAIQNIWTNVIISSIIAKARPKTACWSNGERITRCKRIFGPPIDQSRLVVPDRRLRRPRRPSSIFRAQRWRILWT